MRIFNSLSIFFIITSLTACAAFSPNEIADPSTLTIDEAMESIGEGFQKMKTKLDGNKLGLWPCKVTTTLNVSANADKGGKLVLDTTIKPPADIVTAEIKGNVTQANNSSATRGNTVNIELYSAACIPKDTLGYDKPEKVQSVVDALDSSKNKAPYILNTHP